VNLAVKLPADCFDRTIAVAVVVWDDTTCRPPWRWQGNGQRSTITSAGSFRRVRTRVPRSCSATCGGLRYLLRAGAPDRARRNFQTSLAVARPLPAVAAAAATTCRKFVPVLEVHRLGWSDAEHDPQRLGVADLLGERWVEAGAALFDRP
jgi:hypothetical protein